MQPRENRETNVSGKSTTKAENEGGKSWKLGEGLTLSGNRDQEENKGGMRKGVNQLL